MSKTNQGSEETCSECGQNPCACPSEGSSSCASCDGAFCCGPASDTGDENDNGIGNEEKLDDMDEADEEEAGDDSPEDAEEGTGDFSEKDSDDPAAF